MQGPTVVSQVAWGALPLGNGPFVQPLVARLIAILSAGAVTLHQSAFIADDGEDRPAARRLSALSAIAGAGKMRAIPGRVNTSG